MGPPPSAAAAEFGINFEASTASDRSESHSALPIDQVRGNSTAMFKGGFNRLSRRWRSGCQPQGGLRPGSDQTTQVAGPVQHPSEVKPILCRITLAKALKSSKALETAAAWFPIAPSALVR